MSQAQTGDTVKIHYTGKLDDGTVFDSSTEREPLEFTLGANQVIPGFEDAVQGMSQGETKTTTIASEQAYGPYRADLVMKVQRDQIPDDIPLEIGQQLQLRQQSGQIVPLIVTELSDNQVTLDANHPLAGENLTFDIQLVAID